MINRTRGTHALLGSSLTLICLLFIEDIGALVPNAFQSRQRSMMTNERVLHMSAQPPSPPSNFKPRRRKLAKTINNDNFETASSNRFDSGDSFPNLRNGNVQPFPPPLAASVSDDTTDATNNICCEHFGTCPGCTVMEQVDNVDVIRSARLFFDALTRQKLFAPLQARRRGGGGRSNSGNNKGNVVAFELDQNEFRVVIPTNSVRHWRTQAKLVVAAPASKNPWSKSTNGAGCVFGLYQRNSHSVVSIPQCQVHHPSINQAVQCLEAATAKVRTPACLEESSKTGTSTSTSSTSSTLRTGLRYVQLQVERTTGKICLTLVWFAADVKDTQPALSRLTKELMKVQPELWHSIWLHCHDGLGNNIFSRSLQSSWHLLSGPELLREPLPVDSELDAAHFRSLASNEEKNGKQRSSSGGGGGGGPWLYFTPQTFRQANLDGFEVLALHVARTVTPGAKVCELYAGVGVLGLTALYHHALQDTPLTWLRCSDENPNNPKCFYRAVSSLQNSISGRDPAKFRKPSKPRKEDGLTISQLVEQMNNPEKLSTRKKIRLEEGEKTSYMVASAGAALLAGQALGASVLIVDPPRKGLDEDVLVELCKPINPNQDDAWETPTLLPMLDEKVNWVNSVKTLIYVSCGFEALTRDCDRLFSNRGAGWKLESATGYVLFPGSDHVETICVFQRN